MLLPRSLEELIAEEHLGRVVNRGVDEIDISGLVAKHKGGGTRANHKRLMVKVLVYAYVERIYTESLLGREHQTARGTISRGTRIGTLYRENHHYAHSRWF